MSTPPSATVINDRYEIRSRVGRGGMADVFLANDRLLDRDVAIKVLFPEFAVDPNFVERFRREAQSAANLSHPNIVNVYDWGKYESTYFIAMEYVKGRTLADILKTNDRLTPKQAAEIASEVAAALGFAHQGDVAHRDIKPANILIGSNGQVKVADFGIARAMNSSTESNLTQAGSVMGTAAYFSPEQAQGAQPDPRSDLYSLGIVMYEMVAGKPPFSGENAVSIAYKQVHDQPQPLNQLIDGVPRSFEAIVAKLLAKRPAMRYSNATELRDDLRRFRNGEQVQALVAAAARPLTAEPVPATNALPTVSIDATPAGMTRAYTSHNAVAGAPVPAPAPRTQLVDVDEYPPGSSPEAMYYQDNNQRTGWYALAAFIALIMVIAGGYMLYQQIAKPADQSTGTALPDYRGQTLEAAVADLQDRGLGASPIPEEDPTVPENQVIRTNPEAGTIVPAGRTVTVYFNPTQNLVRIPDVTNKTLDEAKAMLSAAGFSTAEPVEEKNDAVEQGRVIRTDPAADQSVKQDQVITIYVSAGPDQVLIPEVIGKSESDAKAILEGPDVGFVVSVEQQQDAQVEAGLVLATRPGANQYAPRGSTVVLVVSSGPGTVAVPNLIGLSESAALNKLSSLNLVGKVSYKQLSPGQSGAGVVVEQNKSEGSAVNVGSTVEFSIGVAATTTTTSPPITLAPTTPPTTPTSPPTTPTTPPTTPAPETTTTTTLAQQTTSTVAG